MTNFAQTRTQFSIPDGVIYLDGNSLGPLPLVAEQRLANTVRNEWGQQLIRGWNDAGWMDLPQTVAGRIAPLVGAAPGQMTVTDSTSVNLFKVLSAALAARPGRLQVLSDTGNFPTDLYVAQGLCRALGQGHQLHTVAPGDVAGAISDQVAVLMLTQVDYRSGRLHDMAALTEQAHAAGALVIWDLAHSAGALPVDLAGNAVDFAVGCGYKYLNGGPGAPAFLYVAPEHADQVQPALAGWMGHEAPFAFDPEYRPAAGVERMRVGTPAVLGLAALDAAMSLWQNVAMADVRRRSIELSQLFINEVEARCPALTLISPRDPLQRGSQVSFRFAQGYAAMQALIDRGVIGDFRAPDVMRFGITPLYLSPEDVLAAVAVLAEVLDQGLWDRPQYHQRAKVT